MNYFLLQSIDTKSAQKRVLGSKANELKKYKFTKQKHAIEDKNIHPLNNPEHYGCAADPITLKCLFHL